VAVKFICDAVPDAVVVTWKVAEVAPGETTTLGGTDATVESLLPRTTDEPPLGAGPFSVTAADEVAPPVTLAGFSAREVTLGAPIVSIAFCNPL
jgi:hypothetical protein